MLSGTLAVGPVNWVVDIRRSRERRVDPSWRPLGEAQ